MTNVSSAVCTAGRTLTSLFDWAHITLKLLVKQVQFSKIGVNMSMTSVSARIYTVKEVYPAVYCFQNICRGTNAHQVSWFVFRKMRNCHIQNVIHLLMALTNGKSTHCVTVQIHLADAFCMVNTDIIINSSLIDTKKHLIFINRIFQTVQTLHFFFTAFQPACGTVYRWLYITSVCQCRWTLIKCHGNGRSQIRLNLHTFFRSHENFTSIYMRVEMYAFLFDFSQSCQGKYLESAGIRQNRFVPYHKSMQTAKVFDQFVTRTDMQMVCVG